MKIKKLLTCAVSLAMLLSVNVVSVSARELVRDNVEITAYTAEVAINLKELEIIKAEAIQQNTDLSDDDRNVLTVYATTTSDICFLDKPTYDSSSTVVAVIPKGTKLEVTNSHYDATFAKVKYKVPGDWFASTGYVNKSLIQY